MDNEIIDDIMLRLLKALHILRPQSLQFKDFEKSHTGKPVVQVVLVANGLEDLRTSTRWRMCDDLVSQRDPNLYKEYLFAFEAFTPKEYANIRFFKNSLH